MKLKARLFIFMTALFIVFASAVWVYSQSLIQSINEEWAQKFVKKQIVFDKNRILLPIMLEVELIKELAENPSVIAMALHEDDAQLLNHGLDIFEQYRLKLQDKSYFVAFVKSENYYYNDASNQFAHKQLRYKLSSLAPNDRWFYQAINEARDYQVNVDEDSVTGATKVWINYLIKHDGKILGVIGTGLDYSHFLEESVGIEQKGVRNLFINHDLSIQLARDTHLIDYATIANRDGTHRMLHSLISDPKDIEAIKNALSLLRSQPNSDEVKTFWVTFEGKKRLLGIAYLEAFDWFNVTLIDADELVLFKNFSIFPFLTGLFLLALIVVGWVFHQWFLGPLNQLKSVMQRIEKGEYNVSPPLVGNAEIADLSRQFKRMVEFVRANNDALEHKVQERTSNLMQSEAKLATILESVEAYIYIKDTQYRYTYANKKTCEYFGKPLEDVLGKDDRIFFDDETFQKLRSNDQKVIQYGESITIEEINTTQKGRMYRTFLSTKIPLIDENGTIYALCGISTDISERKKAEELIRDMAFYDTLTLLPNRRLLDDRMDLYLESSQRKLSYGAVLFLDLDNFKPLNDAHGHKAGDILLQQVAKRLQKYVRKIDTVARFGGDEFVVILCDIDKNEVEARKRALVIAEKIQSALFRPYKISFNEEGVSQKIEHHCTASIGVTLFSYKDTSKESILQRADKAMYKAKQNGRNRIELTEDEE
ncbi:MAG: diguanylate cyclase [Sulfurospirillaceae bacterium]|nr:diguanylate cyclase [Sulfurospirillaceae bacterium]